MALGDIILGAQGRVCCINGDIVLCGEGGGDRKRRIHLDGKTVSKWFSDLVGATRRMWTWSYFFDYSVSADFAYDPPTGSGSASSDEILAYKVHVANLTDASIGNEGYERFITEVTTQLPSPISFDAGWTSASYTTSGTKRTRFGIVSAKVGGINTEDGGVYVTGPNGQTVENGLVESVGTYKVCFSPIVQVNLENSWSNSGTYALERCEPPEQAGVFWPTSKAEGKNDREEQNSLLYRMYPGIGGDCECVSGCVEIPVEIVRRNGILEIGSVGSTFEIECVNVAIRRRGSPQMELGSFLMRGSTSDMFIISLQGGS